MEILSAAQMLKFADNELAPVSFKEETKTKSVFGIYFSAHWCPPCRRFTQILKDFYEVKMEILYKIISDTTLCNIKVVIILKYFSYFATKLFSILVKYVAFLLLYNVL